MSAQLIEAIIGGGVIVVLGLIINGLKKEVDCKLDEKVFQAEHTSVLNELTEGRKRFGEISKKLEEQTTCLHSLDTTTQLIQQSLVKLEDK